MGGTFFALYINWEGQCQQGTRVRWRVSSETHKEPHACAETGGCESVEWAHGVDVNGVGAMRAGAVGGTCTCHCVWCVQKRRYSGQCEWYAMVYGLARYGRAEVHARRSSAVVPRAETTVSTTSTVTMVSTASTATAGAEVRAEVVAEAGTGAERKWLCLCSRVEEAHTVSTSCTI